MTLSKLTRGALARAIIGLKARKSPHATAAFFTREPDTSRSGPWNTTIYVRGNTVRPLSYAITLREHASYGVRAQWLSEKLLFVQVWLGRIVRADLILDVDAGRFVYQEAANYGTLTLPFDARPRRK